MRVRIGAGVRALLNFSWLVALSVHTSSSISHTGNPQIAIDPGLRALQSSPRLLSLSLLILPLQLGNVPTKERFTWCYTPSQPAQSWSRRSAVSYWV